MTYALLTVALLVSSTAVVAMSVDLTAPAPVRPTQVSPERGLPIQDAPPTPRGLVAPRPAPAVEDAGAQGVCSLGTGTHALSDGVPVTFNPGDSVDDSCFFSFAPVAGTSKSKIVITGASSSNDVEQCTKVGSAAACYSSYDCYAWYGSASNTCELTHGGMTTYVDANRYAGAGSVTITATGTGTGGPSCSLGSGTHALSDGVPVTFNPGDSVNDSCFFSFAPVAGTTKSKIVITGASASNDVEQCSKLGSPANCYASYDCYAYYSFNANTCEFTHGGSTVYVDANRYAGMGSVTIEAVGIAPPPPGPPGDVIGVAQATFGACPPNSDQVVITGSSSDGVTWTFSYQLASACDGYMSSGTIAGEWNPITGGCVGSSSFCLENPVLVTGSVYTYDYDNGMEFHAGSATLVVNV